MDASPHSHARISCSAREEERLRRAMSRSLHLLDCENVPRVSVLPGCEDDYSLKKKGAANLLVATPCMKEDPTGRCPESVRQRPGSGTRRDLWCPDWVRQQSTF